MPTTTQSSSKKTDHYGIERANADDPGAVDKIRSKSGFVDNLMRMNERYCAEGLLDDSEALENFDLV